MRSALLLRVEPLRLLLLQHQLTVLYREGLLEEGGGMTNMYAEGEGMMSIPSNVEGPSSIVEPGFTAADIDAHVNDGNITQPDDSVQVETGLMPFVAPPGASLQSGTDDRD